MRMMIKYVNGERMYSTGVVQDIFNMNNLELRQFMSKYDVMPTNIDGHCYFREREIARAASHSRVRFREYKAWPREKQLEQICKIGMSDNYDEDGNRKEEYDGWGDEEEDN